LLRMPLTLYPWPMSDTPLIEQALSLPLPERVALAEMLWESIDAAPASDFAAEEREALALAEKRSADLAAGVVGRTHEQVLAAARRLVACD
jgi:hypothetical protein